MEAALAGDEAQVARLLSEDRVDLDATDGNGCVAICAASQNGHPGLVRLLCRLGANVAGVCSYGWTAGMYASCGGHDTTIRVPHECKADLDFKARNEGISAVMVAAGCGRCSTMRSLHDLGANILTRISPVTRSASPL